MSYRNSKLQPSHTTLKKLTLPKKPVPKDRKEIQAFLLKYVFGK